jgi:hypothetical protein
VSTRLPALLAPTSARLTTIHAQQVRRDPWPRFDSVEIEGFDPSSCRDAAIQWAGRARNELGSVHQFAALGHALSEAAVPISILGALSRLQTDEARHVELCASLAAAYAGDHGAEWLSFRAPRAPWADAPRARCEADVPAVLAWAAEAVLSACCLGETASVPMLEAIATVATEPTAADVARQILRDEHLHATFGWEVLAWLLPRLDEAGRARVTKALPRMLAGFEVSTCGSLRAEDLAGTTLEVAPGDPAHPNLGTLDERTYAAIFYATLEGEIFPRLSELGLDPHAAWASRPSMPRAR